MLTDVGTVRKKSSISVHLFPEPSQEQLVETTKSQSEEISPFLRYVTVTGLHEIYASNSSLGRLLWILVLVVVTGLALRDIVILSAAVLISDAIHTEEQLLFDQTKLEFTNVSVCVPVSFDRQKVADDFFIPHEAQQRIERQNFSMGYVMEEFTRYFSSYNLYDHVSSKQLERILKLILSDERNNRFVDRLSFTGRRYVPTCRETIVNCTLAQKPTNCCEITQMDLAQASICYTLILSNGNAKFYQSLPGPTGGLSMDVVWNGTNAFYLDGLADEGVYFFVNDVPGLLSVPNVVWPHTHLYVRLKAKQRKLIDDCHETPLQLKYITFYDPAGINCIWDMQIAIYKAFAGCEMPLPPYIPEVENMCTIDTAKTLLGLILNGGDSYLSNRHDDFAGRLLSKYADIAKSIVGFSGNTTESIEKSLFNPPFCKRLCTYSYFDKIVSYASLFNTGSDFDSDRDSMLRSRLTVYYGDFDYSILGDQYAINDYIAFAQIGSILGAYAGLSVVTFVQIIVYGLESISKCIKRKVVHVQT